MHNYSVPPEDVRMMLAIGLMVSIIVYERWRLTGGAAVVAGYLALFIDRPLYVLTTLVVAVGTYYLVQYLIARRAFLYGRRRLVAMVLTGMGLQLVVGAIAYFAFRDVWWLAGLYGVGFVLPGLIAQDIERQGVRATILVVCATTLAAFVLFRDALAVKNGLAVYWNSIAFEDKTIIYSYHTSLLIPAVFLSVLVSAVLYERARLRSGGFLTAAYAALFVLEPLHLVFIAAVSILVYSFSIRLLLRHTPVFGRSKFAMIVLTGLTFTWALEVLIAYATKNSFVPFAGFNIISPMIVALIANDGERQGLPRTLLGAGISTLVVFAVIKGLDLLMLG